MKELEGPQCTAGESRKSPDGGRRRFSQDRRQGRGDEGTVEEIRWRGWEMGQMRGKEAGGQQGFRGGEHVRAVRTWLPGSLSHWDLTALDHFHLHISTQTRKWGKGGHCPETSSLVSGALGDCIVPTQRGSDKSVVCRFWCQWERLPLHPASCCLGYQMIQGL